MNETRVGFIGLGSQGAPMARRIIEAGYPVSANGSSVAGRRAHSVSGKPAPAIRRAIGAPWLPRPMKPARIWSVTGS